eukprot:1190970-Prorocentrum_minimum.AAC.3
MVRYGTRTPACATRSTARTPAEGGGGVSLRRMPSLPTTMQPPFRRRGSGWGQDGVRMGSGGGQEGVRSGSREHIGRGRKREGSEDWERA